MVPPVGRVPLDEMEIDDTSPNLAPILMAEIMCRTLLPQDLKGGYKNICGSWIEDQRSGGSSGSLLSSCSAPGRRDLALGDEPAAIGVGPAPKRQTVLEMILSRLRTAAPRRPGSS